MTLRNIYKPSRWYTIPNDEAFSAFSLGMLFSNSLVYSRFFKKHIFH
jgi:hypothetical protein